MGTWNNLSIEATKSAGHNVGWGGCADEYLPGADFTAEVHWWMDEYHLEVYSGYNGTQYYDYELKFANEPNVSNGNSIAIEYQETHTVSGSFNNWRKMEAVTLQSSNGAVEWQVADLHKAGVIPHSHPI